MLGRFERFACKQVKSLRSAGDSERPKQPRDRLRDEDVAFGAQVVDRLEGKFPESQIDHFVGRTCSWLNVAQPSDR